MLQYLRSAHSSSQDVHTAILKKAAPQVRQTFEKSCLVLFVSDIAFDVEVTITMTHQQFKKTTLFLFCRIRKGEQKEKINDVKTPPSFISSTQIGQRAPIQEIHVWFRLDQDLQEDLDMQEFKISGELM